MKFYNVTDNGNINLLDYDYNLSKRLSVDDLLYEALFSISVSILSIFLFSFLFGVGGFIISFTLSVIYIIVTILDDYWDIQLIYPMRKLYIKYRLYVNSAKNNYYIIYNENNEYYSIIQKYKKNIYFVYNMSISETWKEETYNYIDAIFRTAKQNYDDNSKYNFSVKNIKNNFKTM